MVYIKRLSDWHSAAKYKNQWNNMVINDDIDECYNATIFQTFEWNQIWWQSFNKSNDELLLLLAFEDDELIGIAPLMIQSQQSLFKTKVVHFIGANPSLLSSDFCSFIIDKKNRSMVSGLFVDWLRSNGSIWDKMELCNIPKASPEFKIIKQEFKNYLYIVKINEAPYRCLNADDSYPDLAKRFATKNGNNKYNNLKKLGTISYDHIKSAEEINDKLSHFFNLHMERRLLTSDPSFFRFEEHRLFFQNIVETMSAKGWVILLILKLDNKPISYQFCFEFNQRFYFYTVTFNVEFRKFGVGYMHTVQAFDYILENKIKEVSFGAGDEEYKYRFTDKSTKLVSLIIFNKKYKYIAFSTKVMLRSWIKKVLVFFKR